MSDLPDGQQPSPRRRGAPKNWRATFLATLADTSSIKGAAKAANISPTWVYKTRREDPTFRRQWFDALCEGYDNLEMDLLLRLRMGESKDADAPKFDNAIGEAVNVLGAASPHVFDRQSALIVQLADDSQILVDATPRQLAAGSNRALVGTEVLQFMKASALGAGQWRLEGLLRGRAGTESSIAGHANGEPFVLLDDSIVPLDSALIGDWPNAEIVVIGLADADPVRSPISNRGATWRPLFPVHTRKRTEAYGSASLTWTRRSRGSWSWLDGVDAPLHEQAESYEVSWGSLAAWTISSPALSLDAATLASLQAGEPGAQFKVRQQGTYALSEMTPFL